MLKILYRIELKKKINLKMLIKRFKKKKLTFVYKKMVLRIENNNLNLNLNYYKKKYSKMLKLLFTNFKPMGLMSKRPKTVKKVLISSFKKNPI